MVNTYWIRSYAFKINRESPVKFIGYRPRNRTYVRTGNTRIEQKDHFFKCGRKFRIRRRNAGQAFLQTFEVSGRERPVIVRTDMGQTGGNIHQNSLHSRMQGQVSYIKRIPFNEFFINVFEYFIGIPIHKRMTKQVFDSPTDTAKPIDKIDRHIFMHHIKHFV